MNNQEKETEHRPDSLSTNVLSEGISRALTFVAGIASSVLLVRSIDPSSSIWSTADYNSVKLLTALSSILMPMIMIGMTTAIIKLVSEYEHDSDRIPEIISFAFSIIIVLFIMATIFTLYLGDAIGWLATRPDLKIYWILVLISLLPSAFFQLSMAVFSGMQKMKYNLAANSIYNLVRLLLLVLLFLNAGFSIEAMLWVIILHTSIGVIFSISFMIKELRIRNLLRFTLPSHDLLKYIISIGITFFILSLISVNSNQVPIVFGELYKSNDTEYLYFNISQSITFTIRRIFMAPVAVLMPNLSLIMGSKGIEEVRTRFNEVSRILMPTFLFGSIIVFVYGYAFLGLLYGPAYVLAEPFIQAFSFNLFIVGLTNIYSNLLTSMGHLKALIVLGITQALIQTAWILILAPIFGIIIIAFWWVSFLPLYLLQHYYSRTRFQVTIRARSILRALFLGSIMFVLSYSISFFMQTVLQAFPFIQDEIYFIVILCSIIPQWYIFLALCVWGGLIGKSDIANLITFFRKIPPLWWISKPIISKIHKIRSK